jgi:DNA-binding transcriptional ArsR family regulator
MTELDEKQQNHLLDIKEEITSLHREFNRFVEHSNQQQLRFLIIQMEQKFVREMMDYVTEDTNRRLESSMNPDCKMKKVCETEVQNLLADVARLPDTNSLNDETIQTYQDKFNGLKEIASTEDCDKCMAEATSIFEREIKLIRSLGVYEKTDTNENISDLPEEDAVKQICEPLANKQRVRILKALAKETKSFSQLSNLTKIRGGNLLFHLQKLLDTDMILQHNERGDYMITAKGYSALTNLSQIYSKLKIID